MRSRKGWSCYPISQERRGARRAKGSGAKATFLPLSSNISNYNPFTHCHRARCNPIHTLLRKEKRQPLLLLMLSSHFLWALFEQWTAASKSHIRWEGEKYGACQNRNCHVSLSFGWKWNLTFCEATKSIQASEKSKKLLIYRKVSRSKPIPCYFYFFCGRFIVKRCRRKLHQKLYSHDFY